MNFGSAKITIKADARQFEGDLKKAEATTEAFTSATTTTLGKTAKALDGVAKSSKSAQSEVGNLEKRMRSGLGADAAAASLGKVGAASVAMTRATKALEGIARASGMTRAEVASLETRMRSGLAAESASKALDRVAKAAGLTAAEIRKLEKDMGLTAKGMASAGTQVIKLDGLFSKLAAAAATYFSVQKIYSFGEGIFDAGVKAQKLDTAFKAIAGSAAGAQAEFAFLRKTADDLGMNFWDLAESYKGIAAAAKGTALEGQATRDIFLGVTQAAATLGMTSDQASRALSAVGQIMSKGKLSAEELRGQLGESLYGAFNMAAEAMGITTAKLDDMLKKGMIPAAAFIPKFADVLQNRFGASAKEAANSAQAAVNKFQEAWQDLRVDMANSGFLEDVTVAIKDLTASFKDENFKASLREVAGGLGSIAKYLSSIAQYVGLRSIVGTMGDASKLAAANQLGMSMEDFAKLGFMERQRIVDAANKRLSQESKTQSLINGETQTGILVPPGSLAAEYAQQQRLAKESKLLPAEGEGKSAESAARKRREALEAIQDAAAKYSTEYPEETAIRKLEKELRDLTERAQDAGVSVPAALQQVFEGQVSMQRQMAGYRASGLFSTGASAYDETNKRQGTGAFAVDQAWTKQAQERWEQKRELSRKVWELDATDTQVSLNNLAIQAAAYKQAGVDKALVDQWWSSEANKYSDDWLSGAQRGLKEYTSSVKSDFESASEAAASAMSTVEGVMVDVFRKGKFEASAMADSIISSLARVAVQQSITKPLTSALGSIFGAIGASQFGTPAAAPSTTGGNTGSAMAFTRGYGFHDGGLVGGPATFERVVPAHVFHGAPRYHAGGIAGDEVPAILRKGEYVFTPEQMAAGAAKTPNVTVNIHNAPAGSQVQSRTQDGGLQIDVLLEKVDQHIAGGIARGNGQTAKAIQSTYGASRSAGAVR